MSFSVPIVAQHKIYSSLAVHTSLGNGFLLKWFPESSDFLKKEYLLIPIQLTFFKISHGQICHNKRSVFRRQKLKPEIFQNLLSNYSRR